MRRQAADNGLQPVKYKTDEFFFQLHTYNFSILHRHNQTYNPTAQHMHMVTAEGYTATWVHVYYTHTQTTIHTLYKHSNHKNQ